MMMIVKRLATAHHIHDNEAVSVCFPASRHEEYVKEAEIKTVCFIGIKHVFTCINIRWVPRDVLKTEGAARGFQHRPRDSANVNARKNMFDRYYCIKV